MATTTTELKQPKVVSHAEWLEARKQHLAREREFTHLRDEIGRQRRELPWEPVEKQYAFQGPRGAESLADLFDGRSQLIVYHFMFGPDWTEGCPGCSFLSDHFDGATIHLAHRDVTLAVVSRAPLPRIQEFQKRMGWHFHWVSSFGTDFNYDYGVSFTPEQVAANNVEYNYAPAQYPMEELPGLSVFARDSHGTIFHTYSSYARGGDILIGTYNFLDLVPKGRDEAALAHPMAWLRHHDKYTDGYFVDPTATYKEPERVTKSSCCADHH